MAAGAEPSEAPLLALTGEAWEDWTPAPLPPLEALTSRTGDAFAAASASVTGPTARSNWIIPGRLLCGGAPHDDMRQIIQAGVSLMVSLQARGEARPYRNAAWRLRKDVSFMEHPIPDRGVSSDAQVASLALRVARKVRDGEVVYLHCKGGHGRTGTVAALVLGLAYRLDGPRALATFQALHDTRAQPCFAAPYDSSGDRASMFQDAGSCVGSCVALFPKQREQVLRLLAAPRAEDPAPALGPVPPRRDLSGAYGKGASAYDEGMLAEWKALGEAAGKAARAGEWAEACAGYERCVALRPDHARCSEYLAVSRRKELDARVAAAAAAERGGAGPAAAVGRANAEPAVDDEVAAESAPRSSAAAGSAPPNRLVVLVGLPGAGKSTFAAALAAAGWQVASQDELGKDATEEAVAAAIKAGKRLVVDRCNVTASERRRLLEMRPVRPAAVHFTTAVEECVERVACRTDHPTIPYGCGRPAITSMARDIEPPLASEGFAAVHTVGGADEVNALLLRWGAAEAKCSPEGRIFKFPRTRHVLNTGGSAVTRDDLVMSSDDAVRFFDGRSVVVVEEKVDGANLGFSLSAEYQIGVQNRSHWVAAASHPQFSSLDGWLDEHGWALCQLLVPEVEVLFGEWVAARHSVAYTRLPGHFIAFDIYDKRTRRFVSAAERDRRLAGLGIPVVRSLARRPFSSAADLLTLLEEGSAYGDGFVEGAYLRIDEEFGGGAADAAPVNLRRGKIVRPDFIQGCAEHWTKGGLVRNGVRPDLWAEAEAEP